MPDATHNLDVDQRVRRAGASKTVYALVTPHTEAAKHLIFGNCVVDPDGARRRHLEQFRDAWTGKQFISHEVFMERWTAWAAPLVAMGSALRCRYPTSGASEALFHVISGYGNRARNERFVPELHVFAGEYEGYRAYAEACGITVIEHARVNWEVAARQLPRTALFCLSQPSAIDGNLWPHANAFLAALATCDRARLVLDLTYVGAIAHDPGERIAADGAALQAVVFSLSKPFGVYYDRIGGIFLPRPDAEPDRQSMVQESHLAAARDDAH
jgi:hypothetical protein